MSEMDREQILSLLMINTAELWSRTLDGSRSATAEALHLVLSNPKPGDLVLEISRRNDDPSRFGRLIKIAEEPMDNWSDEEINGPPPNDTFWYVEGIDGQVHRWYNCQFIRVLEKPIYTVEEALEETKARGVVTPPRLVARLQEIEKRVQEYVRG